jgi:hypothetical protein
LRSGADAGHRRRVQDSSDIEAEIRRQTTTLGAGASLSPTDIARALSPPPGDAWRGRLPAVRRAAIRLALAGEIEILRKGRPVAPEAARGVIRLRQRIPSQPQNPAQKPAE